MSSLRQLLDATADHASAVVPPATCEINENVELTKPMIVEGNGATLWARTGPVLTIRAPQGVRLRNLSVEVVDSQQTAIAVEPGASAAFENVFVAGKITGMVAGQVWSYPRVLVLRLRPGEVANTSITVAEPCTVRGEGQGWEAIAAQLPAGTTTLVLALPASAVAGTALRGRLQIIPQSGTAARSIPVFGWVRTAEEVFASRSATEPALPTAPSSKDFWTRHGKKLLAAALVAAVGLGITVSLWKSTQGDHPLVVAITPAEVNFGTLLCEGRTWPLSTTNWITVTYKSRHRTNLQLTLTWSGTGTRIVGTTRERFTLPESQETAKLTEVSTRYPLTLGFGEEVISDVLAGARYEYTGTITVTATNPPVRLATEKVYWQGELKRKSD